MLKALYGAKCSEENQHYVIFLEISNYLEMLVFYSSFIFIHKCFLSRHIQILFSIFYSKI